VRDWIVDSGSAFGVEEKVLTIGSIGLRSSCRTLFGSSI